MHQFWRLTAVDAEAAGGLLTRAFRDAPHFVQGIPDPERRLAYCSSLFTVAIRYGCRLGEAWAIGSTSSQMAGVAFWIAMPEPEWTPEFQTELGFDVLEDEWGSLVHELHAPVQHAVDAISDLPEHWRYLDMIGVDPQWQGQGFGGALLRKVLADAAEARLPVALVTHTSENDSFYLHHGFSLLCQGTTPGSDLPFWSFRTFEPC
jgi:GNAT superfamily N-acetyltransferase